MSAHAIDPGRLFVAFACTTALAWTASGRRRGPFAIGAGLPAVQSALHLVFAWGESHAGTPHAGAPGSAHTPTDHLLMGEPPVGHTSAARPAVGDAPTADTLLDTALGTVTGHTSVGMFAAHLLAAVICGLWLARGEAALFALARAVAARTFTPLRLLLAVAPVPAPPRPRPGRTRPHHHHRLRGVVLAHTLSRRGPPRLSAPRATALGVHV
ncbi:hypothetical protein [Streptomyces sp. NPDC053755]|uniref:hypothetical protein n=1 Tax=Streptomyces sp. NPDC053755 TaxID=3155815 RepID=UPI00343D3D57